MTRPMPTALPKPTIDGSLMRGLLSSAMSSF
jgi:hypothetical protein